MTPRREIARAAYAEATKGKAFALLQIVFQSEVTFETPRPRSMRSAGRSIRR
jgi:hypothetical protein